MAQKKAARNFLQGAIEHLSKEDFDELVRIFQLSYWQNKEVGIIENGTWAPKAAKVIKDN